MTGLEIIPKIRLGATGSNQNLIILKKITLAIGGVSCSEVYINIKGGHGGGHFKITYKRGPVVLSVVVHIQIHIAYRFHF